MAVFTLSALNSSFTLDASAKLLAYLAPTILTCSAEAVIHVKSSDLRALFRFQTDASSVGDSYASNIDTKYFLDSTQLDLMFATNDQSGSATDCSGKVLNPVHAALDSVTGIGSSATHATASDKNQNLVRADFVRYLAYETTGSVNGVDLFDNENALLEDLGDKGHVAFFETIRAAFDAAGTNAVPLSNGTSDESNLVRQVMRQMTDGERDRFADLTALPFSDDNGDQPIPFEDGDIIEFKLTITPHADTEVVTTVNGADGTDLGDRTYRIKIKCVSDANAASTGYENWVPSITSADGLTTTLGNKNSYLKIVA